MSEPTWHDGVPDRTNDPRIKRSIVAKAVIAAFKRGSRGHSYQFLRVLSVNRRLFRPFLALNARMMPRGKLPRIETEAVILFTAARCGSKYEWTQHTALGKRAGLTDEQVELIASDAQSEQLPENLRLVLRAAGEILDDRVLSDATWDALSARYTPDLILELVMLTGNYAMLAGALNSFGAPLEAAWAKGR